MSRRSDSSITWLSPRPVRAARILTALMTDSSIVSVVRTLDIPRHHSALASTHQDVPMATHSRTQTHGSPAVTGCPSAGLLSGEHAVHEFESSLRLART
jgi:hypothetical protein